MIDCSYLLVELDAGLSDCWFELAAEGVLMVKGVRAVNKLPSGGIVYEPAQPQQSAEAQPQGATGGGHSTPNTASAEIAAEIERCARVHRETDCDKIQLGTLDEWARRLRT